MFDNLTHQELVNLAELLYRAIGNAIDAMRRDHSIGFDHPINVMGHEIIDVLVDVSLRHGAVCLADRTCPPVTL